MNIPAVAGGTVNVPVNINVTEVGADFSATFDVIYDPLKLTFANATQGAFWTSGAAGWQFGFNVISPGDVRVGLFNVGSPSATAPVTLRTFNSMLRATPPVTRRSMPSLWIPMKVD